MISALLVALVYIAIVALIVWGITAIIPAPAPVKTVIYVVGGIICLLILLQAITGGGVPALR